ncbi:hypothetical protein L1887_15093 [Cichorium endivia]|nr:hypothetical protein L1887_15093 [Cichorium endivia]
MVEIVLNLPVQYTTFCFALPLASSHNPIIYGSSLSNAIVEIELLDLSDRSSGAIQIAEHDSVLGDWIRQNTDCDHASSPLCLSVEKTITL